MNECMPLRPSDQYWGMLPNVLKLCFIAQNVNLCLFAQFLQQYDDLDFKLSDYVSLRAIITYHNLQRMLLVMFKLQEVGHLGSIYTPSIMKYVKC